MNVDSCTHYYGLAVSDHEGEWLISSAKELSRLVRSRGCEVDTFTYCPKCGVKLTVEDK